MVGDFLKELRSRTGYSQSQVARRAGVSQPNISAYESGERVPTADTLNRLVVACGFQLAALADDDRIILCRPPVARPGALPGDPPDEAPTLAPDAPPEIRGRVLYDLLELTDALRRRPR